MSDDIRQQIASLHLPDINLVRLINIEKTAQRAIELKERPSVNMEFVLNHRDDPTRQHRPMRVVHLWNKLIPKTTSIPWWFRSETLSSWDGDPWNLPMAKLRMTVQKRKKSKKPKEKKQSNRELSIDPFSLNIAGNSTGSEFVSSPENTPMPQSQPPSW